MRRKASAEEGVVAVLTALLMVVLLTSVAFTIDLGRLRHEKQTLQNAVDLSSLAGAGLLPVKTPVDALKATNLARAVALANAPELATAPPNSLQISYKCVVSDTNGNGGQDSPDLGFSCGPQTPGSWSNAASWTLKPGRSSHICDPNAGDSCNTIVVRASNIVPYYFAPVIGINQGSTGVVQGAACTGTCGIPQSPLDVVMVLDRTTSMTSTDVQQLKQGAKAVLDAYDASQQWVGVIALPYGLSNDKCHVNPTQNYPTNGFNPASTWEVASIQSGYDNPDGSTNTSSPLWTAINCLTQGNTPTVNVSGMNPLNQGSHGQTDLGDPLDAAQYMLAHEGRANVPDVVIFETDGQANQPYLVNQGPCNYLNQQATQAKGAGLTIYTIAYGLDNPPVKCTDPAGPYFNRYATQNLSDAANTSIDNSPGGCDTRAAPLGENYDGDNYFCVPANYDASNDLKTVFKQVATISVKKSRLLDV